MSDLQCAIDDVTGENTANCTSKRRVARQAPDGRQASGSSFISTTSTVVTLAFQTPFSYSIFTMIQTVVTVTVVCTPVEVQSLITINTQVAAAVVAIQVEVTYATVTILSATGGTVTEDDLDGIDPCLTLEDCQGSFQEPTTTMAPTTTMEPTTTMAPIIIIDTTTTSGTTGAPGPETTGPTTTGTTGTGT